MAIEMPIAIPRAASAITQPKIVAAVTPVGSIAGQRPNKATVSARASAARAGSGAAFIPGSGTNTIAPPTRESTSRKLYRVPAESVRLSGIACQVSEEQRGIRDGLLQHPGE